MASSLRFETRRGGEEEGKRSSEFSVITKNAPNLLFWNLALLNSF
jgi:hypothetical protein